MREGLLSLFCKQTSLVTSKSPVLLSKSRDGNTCVSLCILLTIFLQYTFIQPNICTSRSLKIVYHCFRNEVHAII